MSQLCKRKKESEKEYVPSSHTMNLYTQARTFKPIDFSCLFYALVIQTPTHSGIKEKHIEDPNEFGGKNQAERLIT